MACASQCCCTRAAPFRAAGASIWLSSFRPKVHFSCLMHFLIRKYKLQIRRRRTSERCTFSPGTKRHVAGADCSRRCVSRRTSWTRPLVLDGRAGLKVTRRTRRNREKPTVNQRPERLPKCLPSTCIWLHQPAYDKSGNRPNSADFSCKLHQSASSIRGSIPVGANLSPQPPAFFHF